ncbi:Uncharacterised protein [Mycobacteroides abscessus subsp. abscessus]|nr:Uncharacterised protein [Mycobacteroides abscessus subsp. abscessus]SIK58602.1 Uncharacterised protein [Mycobacteroides abscessus subsp. abscessus]SIL83172.1 Uncharacterised protein [Mycobacteroides abscessus subsp. abscessus]SIM13966.1 Uncharacterised protein [Mycobacteroides abscessus subsp. abscessus]SIM34516.1 Uncharacterised protein [Mycobacteroides abscessus subsp. abscessus]
MCPPRPQKSLSQILFEASMSVFRQRPELLHPERYYTVSDELDWTGRTAAA